MHARESGEVRDEMHKTREAACASPVSRLSHKNKTTNGVHWDWNLIFIYI